MPPRTARRAGANAGTAERPLRFEQRLVLHQWLLGLFGVPSFERLAANLKAPEYEGFDENNVTRFHHNLKLLFDRPELPHDLLLATTRTSCATGGGSPRSGITRGRSSIRSTSSTWHCSSPRSISTGTSGTRTG